MNGFTAADMTTAAANGFRDGLAAQPASAQEAVRPACEILAGVTDAAHGGRRVWVLDGVRFIREDICVAAIDDARSAASAPVAAAPDGFVLVKASALDGIRTAAEACWSQSQDKSFAEWVRDRANGEARGLNAALTMLAARPHVTLPQADLERINEVAARPQEASDG